MSACSSTSAFLSSRTVSSVSCSNFLTLSFLCASGSLWFNFFRCPMPEPKKIAAIVTEYRKWSHADVIVGKILEGYNYDGGAKPALKIVSMVVDQFPENDMSRAL